MNIILFSLCVGLELAVIYITIMKLLKRPGARRFDIFYVPVGTGVQNFKEN